MKLWASTGHIEVGSELAASVDAVWHFVGAMSGVNYELAPWVRMTVAPAARAMRVEDAPLGRLAFQSWVLLFGVIPYDRHGLTITSVAPPHGFLEESPSWTQRLWRHERRLDARGSDRCVLWDRVTFTPRVPGVAALLAPVIGFVFRHRHRRLRGLFGGRALP
jgi:hypothetical protein